MRGLYKDLQNSLFYFITLFKNEYLDISPNIKVFKFDAFADGDDLPVEDLIGPQAFSITDDEGLIYVDVKFLVCTNNDKNLFRLDDLIDALYNWLKPANKLPIVKSDSGAITGTYTVGENVLIAPVSQAVTRPVKSISVSLFADLSSKYDPGSNELPSFWDDGTSWDESLLWQ